MNILIIDDTKADHELCVEFLNDNENNFRFFHAYNGAQGLELCRQHPIDCILLDYNLPDLSGLEVLRLLCSENKSLPVIMLTGEGSEVIAVTAMKLGSQDYIPKKVITASALKRAIERTIERSHLLKEMEQTRADLERSNRDLEQFANIVAHDLKSPLRAVIMHLGLISRKLADALDEKTKRSLEFAVNGAERMQALIDALFTYAKLGFCEPAMSTFCLNEAVKNAQNDLSAISKETHAQITHDTLPQVTGNPVMLSQLLQNLIANAIKYCKVTPRIHISASLLDGKWRISVRDNGIGIPAAQHEKIFAIFRRLHLDEEYPGIGLGLAICKRIVTLHDGEISVESAPDEGSVFHFTLPAASAPLEQKKVAHG